MIKTIFFDIEVYTNFFQVGLLVDDEYISIDIRNDEKWNINKQKQLIKLIRGSKLVGFNSISYDNIFINILTSNIGLTSNKLKAISDEIIEGNNLSIFNILNKYNAKKYIYQSIDLYKTNNSGGLKFYGANMGLTIRELPYNPNKILTNGEIDNIIKYNINDLIITKALYKKSLKQLTFRGELNKKYADMVDIYNPYKNFKNMGDATIGEKLINYKLKPNKNLYTNGSIKSFKLDLPDYLSFENSKIQKLLNRVKQNVFVLKDKKIEFPKWLKSEKIIIGNNTFNIALGGLHSTEKCLRVTTEGNKLLRNIDVQSYYPNLQFINNFTPINIKSSDYINLGNTLLNERVKAKLIQKKLSKKPQLSDNEKLQLSDAKITNSVNKIILNGGMYGKLGDLYCKYYDPKTLLNVTLTGQFSLLMLIEWLELAGVKVISSNTDGIEIIHDFDTHTFEEIETIVSKWENVTKLTMEYGEYKSLFARDVNAYIAKYFNEVKAKGIYANTVNTINKKLQTPIVYKIIRELINDKNYIIKDIDELRDYILDKLLACNNLLEFCTVQKVTGGAILIEDGDKEKIEYNNLVTKRDKQQNIVYGVIPKSKREKVNGIDIKEYAEKNGLINTYYFQIYDKNNIKTEYERINNSVFNYQDFENLGNYIRYIYTSDKNKIVYKKTSNNVPMATNLKIVDNNINEYNNFKSFIDYDRYIDICISELEKLSYIKTPKTNIIEVCKKKIIIVSLFDGLSGAKIALDRSNLSNDYEIIYYSSEIDRDAIKISKSNYNNLIRLGDVTKINFEQLHQEIKLNHPNSKIILVGGSPCQNLSSVGDRRGILVNSLNDYLKLNNEDKNQSSLFWEYVRAYRYLNPDFFILENVASMSVKDKNIIANQFNNIYITKINSNLVSAQNRNRYYFTNFKIKSIKDKEIKFKDLVNRNIPFKKGIPNFMLNRFGKNKRIKSIKDVNSDKFNTITTSKHHTNMYLLNANRDSYRNLTVNEVEQLQNLPINYTNKVNLSDNSKFKAIGNGFTIDIIKEILKSIL